MADSVFEELKRYVLFDEADERALRELHPIAKPHFERISVTFYDRILEHEGARTALIGGESVVGRLKITLVAWMDTMLTGPWDEAYYERRARIGRVHVRIALPQHYMFGAMNVLRQELLAVIDSERTLTSEQRAAHRRAVEKILDLELGVMLHTYREDLLAQQARVERLSTFGQLVGSIGHELRNPLGVMESSLFILKQRLPEDERAQKHANRIGEQLGIASQIITKLLELIRDRPLSRAEVKLGPVIESAVQAVRPPEGVAIEVRGVGELPSVSGDATQLRQVFVNLLENAAHAITGRPGAHIKVVGKVGRGAVILSVEDNGPGVPPDVKARLFEPLVTGKVKGIGLGLALVKRIVERHGGTLAHRVPDGGGACFQVNLPMGGPLA